VCSSDLLLDLSRFDELEPTLATEAFPYSTGTAAPGATPTGAADERTPFDPTTRTAVLDARAVAGPGPRGIG
jgi:hypothetical protein